MSQGPQAVRIYAIINVPTHIEVTILFILSFLQSAVTCLQWPMENNIAFGLAEGKVKEGREPQERLGVGIIVMKKEIWLISFRVELCGGGECIGTSFFLFLFSFSFLRTWAKLKVP